MMQHPIHVAVPAGVGGTGVTGGFGGDGGIELSGLL